jgi:TonB family protein
VREAASQILVERAIKSNGLRRTIGISTSVHFLVLLGLFFGPASWLNGQMHDNNPDIVMSIRLGGPEGPGVGGETPLGGRPIQQILPLQELRRPQWIQPPSPTPPKMTLPAKTARRNEPETEISTVPDEARGNTPTRGPELLEGSAMSDTGAEGIGVGLSGGGLGGSNTELSLADFCCPEYLATMIQLIRRQWDSNQQVPGLAIIRFTIQRGGMIKDVGVDKSSGYFALDTSAQRAILLTPQLPPLPSAFTQSSLTVRLTFEYRR